MKIKKYIAPTMPEAMNEIRKELGPDAVILNSKEIQQGGFLGFFKKKKIEVVAALDPNPIPTKKEMKVSPIKKRETKPLISQHSNEVLLKEIQNLKKVIDSSRKESTEYFPLDYQLVYQYLLEQEVDPEIAREVVDKVVKQHEELHASPDSGQIKADTQLAIRKLFESYTIKGIEANKQVIQFVGPTGVGKTTTIAKVAANMMLNEHKRIAFITSDTYRIAAIDQLKTYARILNVPIEVAYTVEDYKNAVLKFKGYDAILVDTAGRNFREEKYVKELKNSMNVNTEIDTYLVLSLTAKPKDIMEIYDQFHHIPLKAVIFTKVDETRQYGSLLNITRTKQIPIVYVTNGQDVPNDILQVTPEMISKLIIGDPSDK
ncbi:flagellar biosynthesis protein FlhF [Oceanobacillus bengalensis]|uniref:Flagellar biosynthesis protein FlhF n=1 Tax=Oceanobacillus bengalensis TaxID=1435466 RepID=A0A494Z487_9BACI|nr:flagellar biosynthesis protein FlhF [Oceanobacillus bengalensis]RKQ17354.1 flagellar biosynthesis protein FlhF [Oceanobacillus bengalensis]